MDYENNSLSPNLYAYDNERKLMEVYDKTDVKESLPNGHFIEIDLKDLLSHQDKWVGKYIMEGHSPDVDFAFDQMLSEIQQEEMSTLSEQSAQQTILEATAKLHVRFKDRKNPALQEQKKRLDRMASFMKEVAESDTTTDYVVLNKNYKMLTGFPVLARAIMEQTGTLNAIVVENDPKDYIWLNVQINTPNVNF